MRKKQCENRRNQGPLVLLSLLLVYGAFVIHLRTYPLFSPGINVSKFQEVSA